MGLLVISIGVWGMYVSSYSGNYIENDSLNRKVFEWNWLENCCSWWPITHLISFTILSYLFTYCEKVLFLGGVAWELFEAIMNYIIRGTLKKQAMRVGIDSKVQYSEIWWAGSIKDILFNILGIIIGRNLRLAFNPPARNYAK